MSWTSQEIFARDIMDAQDPNIPQRTQNAVFEGDESMREELMEVAERLRAKGYRQVFDGEPVMGGPLADEIDQKASEAFVRYSNLWMSGAEKSTLAAFRRMMLEFGYLKVDDV